MIPPPGTGAFLNAHGWGGAAVRPLAGDASFRRYFRVVLQGRTAVLMDAPPDKEDSRPFLAIGRHLDALGFSAPQALATDLDQGLVLLEDFGDGRVNPVLAADASNERAIYETAVDILAELHRHPPADVPPYNEAELLREARLFPDWYLPAVGLAEAPGYNEAWAPLWPALFTHPPVLVLRDYHADNLMLLDRPGLKRLGLLDYQDALAGHPAYDLASLLQDIRRVVLPDLEAAMIARYIRARPGLDEAAFRTAYAILAAQRNIKILGVFTRLYVRDGKPSYPAFHPRLWELVNANLAHPALSGVQAWFDANVPASARHGVEVK
ncbi:aminoglycoside phosphotransferase family protein [Sandarakinorhabdus oryzae]|uniref:aminoglycoside phosphotransferase family protein n=1 Tax=Sandarakinorhabdus oryzae TaxID=2675220 RepID=UPI0012E2C296|nr:phosphotransferase [Sandarakinorhabdus oryzae]